MLLIPTTFLRSTANIITRLGFREDATKEAVVDAIERGFAHDDSLYALLQEYPIHPWTSYADSVMID